jgi:hypothetical protein
MDEKRFDVDGTYNARYEVVKNVLTKPTSKEQRKELLKKRKLPLCTTHEETEYLKYIKFLQFKGILEPTIEQFDVEELQGVSGLKAIRIKVSNIVDSNCYHKSYTYQELLDELD